jgi:signal recognition particle subunit SRP68
MSNLPGLLYDKLVQSDIELQCQYFRTFRAYYISLFYLYNKKYKESIGFCFRVETYLKQLESRLQTIKEKETELDKSKLKEFEAQLKQLRLDLNQSKYKIQTNAILEDDSMLDEMSPKEKEAEREKLEKIPLKERLDIYFEEKSTNVVKMGLDYESIPCKPLFFDLALNHVELPSLDDKIDRPARAGQQGQQGVTGLIRGFFGFK